MLKLLALGMKLLRILLLLLFTAPFVKAQDASALIKEGVQLSTQNQYPLAIEKYKSALVLEPENPQANYQLAFAMFASGKGLEGLPYLEKVLTITNTPLTTASYNLMGSIYENANQLSKAIKAYKYGIKADSTNQRIYYNLGIAQYRSKLYEDAEQSFMDAVSRDSADAGSVRMYALTNFHENKRAQAILGFCRFLQLEPNTARSKEAFGNLRNILQRGMLPPESGYQPAPATKAEAMAQNKVINKVLAVLMTRKYASPTALLTAQLKELFTAFGTQPKLYWLAGYFYKLSQTGDFEAFVKLIIQSSTSEKI